MTGCSQPAALSACHGLMIIPGAWQPQPGTWHNQPIIQTPTWDCHWFSCQPEISRSCGGRRPRAPGGQGWEQPMPRALLMSLQVPSDPLTLCCFALKTLNRRLSRWRVAQVCRPTLLIPYTICVPFKAAGVGEGVSTGSCLPTLPPTPSSGTDNPSRDPCWDQKH